MLEPQYDAKEHEEDICKLWDESGYFDPENLPQKDGEPYTIIMPPPNANGEIHIGHALFLTLEDILARYQRMRGKRVLWLPGTDHAGFETQVVFEKKLEKEGKSRFGMKREEFYGQVMEFVQNYKKLTEAGIRRMGSSCDWSRNIFTLDPRIVEIVYDTFERMWKDGLVYRGERICNWCPKHQTALSDLETKFEEREDVFYYLKYGPFTIGTARPETKFGDKYVVMHPEDKRYKDFKHGQKLDIPDWINGPITATVIKDDAVDMAFGTGVMTITPWHDAADFDIARRHGLDIEQVIDKTGKLLPIAGEFAGMHISKARSLIVEKLKTKGLLDEVKTDPRYKHSVQMCYKCKTVIEPQVIPQWYVAVTKSGGGKSSLRDTAMQAVTSKKITIIPERFEKVFMHWMEELRDWPISRQIWWGIPIPVWYCGGVQKANMYRFGFHERTESQIVKDKKKIKTYRLRDHGLAAGSRFAFENSQTKRLFGYGTVTAVEKTTVGKLPLDDEAHGATYRTRQALIEAFKFHHPLARIDKSTPVYVIAYTFSPIDKENAREGCGEIILSRKTPPSCPACGGKNLVQDPDTFDTWFSSGQWPYATLMAQDMRQGTRLRQARLPDGQGFGGQASNKGQGSDFETYYPTSVMETGWDILFFWVARMIMLGLYRTGKIPFKTVYLHGLVRDKDRQKMSKSKGNVVDPLGVIDLYGTDALRFALVFSTAAGNDIPLDEQKIKGMKHFANKLWNIARFVSTNVDLSTFNFQLSTLTALTDADRELLSELEQTKKEVTERLDAFEFHEAAQAVYHFTWHHFADVYIEASKKQLADDTLKENTKKLLSGTLIATLKLLHPFMPFVTEAIYQKIRPGKLLMIESWPD
jgi:valyl-tRNA synthetase